MNKLHAVTIRAMLAYLDHAQYCWREGLPESADNYIDLVRKNLLQVAVSDVEVEPVPAAVMEPAS
jgi:hypothetical protein